jgi:Tfp pilus assembly protein PilO
VQQSQLEQLRQDLMAEEERLREAMAYKATVDELGRQYEALTEALPETLTSADLMRSISNEATAAGLSISRIADSAQVEEAETHEAIAISVDLRGSFAQILTFMASLTHLNLVTSVGELTMAGSSLAAGELVQVSFTAVVRGYRILPRPQREVSAGEESW